MTCLFQVHIISTKPNTTGEDATRRRNNGGERVEVFRPPSVEN